MKTRATRWLAAANGLGLLAVAVVARGDVAADAWKPCGDGCLARGKSKIEIVHGVDEAKTRAALKGDVVHDEDVTIDGKPGKVIVAFGDALTATALVGTDAVVLTAPIDEAGEAAHTWAAMIERLGTPAVAAEGSLKIVNIEADCAAPFYLDGVRRLLDAGATQDVAIASASVFVEWQERDGGYRMAAAESGAQVRIGCPPPVKEPAKAVAAVPPDAAPAAPVAVADAAPPVAVATTDAGLVETDNADASGGPRASLEPAFAGARSAVLFYRGLWSIVLDGKLWDEPRSLDRLMLKVLQLRPRDRWDDLATYTALEANLERALANANGDATKLTELRRVATELMLATSQVGAQNGCAAVQDATMTTEARTEAVDCSSNRISRMGTRAKDLLGLRILNAATIEPPIGSPVARLAELAK